MEWTILNNISLANKVTTYFTSNWSKDGRIFIVTDASVSIFKFDSNFKNHENYLHFIKSEVKLCDYHVANETGINMDEHLLNLSKENMYNALLNHNLTPVTKHATPITKRPINAAWAPIPKSNALLFVLSNTGNVEIYKQKQKTWELLANVTEFWVKHLQNKSWVVKNNGDCNTLCELHADRVSQCLATCFALSKVYYDENNVPFFFIVVGYALEYITIWKYYFNNNKTEPIFLNKIDTILNNLTTLFICSLNNTDWIVLGNIDGIVKAIPIINFNTNSLKNINKFVEIWTYKDVRVSKVINLQINEFLCLLIIKGPFVVLSVLNTEQELVCVKHLNVKNLNITGIVPFDTNSCVISTFTGVLYLLKINKNNKDFVLNLSPIKTDLKWDYHACYGLVKSPGEILWGVVTYPCKMTDHLIVRNAIQINFLMNNNFDADSYLKNQITTKLNHFAECIDILRCISSKNCSFPSLWLTAYEKYDDLTVREIQILMWTAEFCQTFISKKPRFKKLNNPFPPPDILKAILFFKFRLERINKLFLLQKEKGFSGYTTIQQNSLYLLYDAMIRFQKDENFNLYFGEKISKQTQLLSKKMKKLKLETDIKCLWCEDKLTSEPCSSNHPDQRCCITGVQISGIARIECEKCNMPADEHIAGEEIVCPLCNVLMIQIT